MPDEFDEWIDRVCEAIRFPDELPGLEGGNSRFRFGDFCGLSMTSRGEIERREKRLADLSKQFNQAT
jgi:hypothetical protein